MDSVISIKNLVKNYDKLEALKGINLEIKKGEFFGLLGPNGAGKTTMINIMTALCNKTSGTVEIYGHDHVKNYREARKYIGLVPQEFNFDQFSKVIDMLLYQGGFYGIPRDECKKRAEKILKMLDLWEKRDSKLRYLSGGMKRRAMIARSLIHNPKVLILDEPTAGVDVELRKSTWEFIKKLNKQGVTILLTTHYIEEAEELCDRVAIINHGKIIALDRTHKLMDNLESSVIQIYLEKKIDKVPEKLKAYSPQLSKDKTILKLCFNKTEHSYNELLKAITATKLKISNIQTSQNKLEDVFIKLTRK